jgi:hypothetical protein
MKRCLFLIAMAMTVSSMSGCIVDGHRPYRSHGDDRHHCDRGHDHDCHNWRH